MASGGRQHRNRWLILETLEQEDLLGRNKHAALPAAAPRGSGSSRPLIPPPTGRIDLAWSIEGLQQGARIHLVWQESELKQRLLRANGGFESQCAERAGRLDQAAVMARERVQARLAERSGRVEQARASL